MISGIRVARHRPRHVRVVRTVRWLGKLRVKFSRAVRHLRSSDTAWDTEAGVVRCNVFLKPRRAALCHVGDVRGDWAPARKKLLTLNTYSGDVHSIYTLKLNVRHARATYARSTLYRPRRRYIIIFATYKLLGRNYESGLRHTSALAVLMFHVIKINKIIT